jgi:hypothetical protein
MSAHDESIAGPPDMTAAAFCVVLGHAESPAYTECAAMHRACVAAGVRPSALLAFFAHESGFGRQGIVRAYQTMNPGNVRSLAPPADPSLGAVIQTTGGPFVKYRSWEAGTADWCKRLRGPLYEGAGLRTVRQVIPKYAPSADGNSPEAYIAAVLASIARYTEAAPMPEPQLTTRVSLLPADAPNNPDRPMWGGKPAWVTIHETDNPNVGANAEMHRRFVLAGGGPDTASFHAVCDDRESIQLLPWTAAAYHIGDGDGGEGNNTSIGIELCVNADGDFRATTTRGAELAAALLRRFGLPLERLRQHGDWWSPAHPDVHRGCPAHLKAVDIAGASWAVFRLRVQQALAGAGDDDPFALDFDTLVARVLS